MVANSVLKLAEDLLKVGLISRINLHILQKRSKQFRPLFYGITIIFYL